MSKLVIAVSTKLATADTIERRYVMWGLVVAMLQMIEEKDFRSAVFLLKWRGDIMGSVAFYPEDFPTLYPQSHSPNRTTQLFPPVSFIGDSANGSVLSIVNPLVVQLGLVFSELEPLRPLDRYDMLINLISVLIEAAEHPADAIVRARYTISMEGFGIRVFVSGKGGSQPPSTSPFLTYRWVIMAMTQIPMSLARLHVNNAFKIELFLDRVSIAEVVVIPNPFHEASVNVSTA